MELTQWTRLQCTECQGDVFTKTFHLVSRQGGGTTESPIGWECQACRSAMDMGKMQDEAEVREMERQIQEKRLQLEQRSAKPAPKSPSLSVSS